MLRRGLYKLTEVATREELRDEVRSSVVLTQVVDGDHVGMRAELGQELGFTPHADTPGLIEPVRLDQGEGDLALEHRVPRPVDDLPAPFAEESKYRVAASGEGGGQR